MTVLQFPGVGDGPMGRPATYEEYLVSIGLSANTRRNYLWRVDKAERLPAGLGATELAGVFSMPRDTYK